MRKPPVLVGPSEAEPAPAPFTAPPGARPRRARRWIVVIVGLLLVVGAPQPAFDPFLSGATLRAGEQLRTVLDWPALLPVRRATYRYDGSMTTPPGTDGIRWIVLRQPVSLSRAQLDTLFAAHPNNVQPLQPRNGRQVLAVSEA